MSDKAKIDVEFLPLNARVSVPRGSLVTGAMLAAGVLLPLDCGGNGTCGRCLVHVQGETSEPNQAEQRLLENEQLEKGWRLACQTKALGDLVVAIPETAESADSSWRMEESDNETLDSTTPVVTSLQIDIPAPTLEDPRSDLERVLAQADGAIRADIATASQISVMARGNDWRLSAYTRGDELVGVAPPDSAPLGLAVDLGSTKIAAYLVNLEDGQILASRGRLNPQVTFGADVVTRLQRAISTPADGKRQTGLVRKALNELAGVLASKAGATRGNICEMTLVGNSAMHHLLLDLPLVQLGAPPFVASLGLPLDVKASDLGLQLAPGAYLHLPPLVGGFVGSDNVAMIVGSGLDRPGPVRLGLDIGTNTEVVVTCPEGEHRLFIASAPSGPTFEGAHLSSGMRAMAGAISKVEVRDDEPVCTTIDGSAPAGVCGSGIIDVVAELLAAGVINPQGHLDRANPRVKVEKRSISYVLVPAEHSATGRDIVVTQSDISQVQLAKAAISAAARTLMDLAGQDMSQISQVVLAGSFGSHIDVESARRIGLIPDVEGAQYMQVGNAAGRGVGMVLADASQRQRAADVPAMSHYVELASEKQFNPLFARSLAFPK